MEGRPGWSKDYLTNTSQRVWNTKSALNQIFQRADKHEQKCTIDSWINNHVIAQLRNLSPSYS